MDPNQPRLTCEIHNSGHGHDLSQLGLTREIHNSRHGHDPNKVTHLRNMSLFSLPLFSHQVGFT